MKGERLPFAVAVVFHQHGQKTKYKYLGIV